MACLIPLSQGSPKPWSLPTFIKPWKSKGIQIHVMMVPWSSKLMTASFLLLLLLLLQLLLWQCDDDDNDEEKDVNTQFLARASSLNNDGNGGSSSYYCCCHLVQLVTYHIHVKKEGEKGGKRKKMRGRASCMIETWTFSLLLVFFSFLHTTNFEALSPHLGLILKDFLHKNIFFVEKPKTTFSYNKNKTKLHLVAQNSYTKHE